MATEHQDGLIDLSVQIPSLVSWKVHLLQLYHGQIDILPKSWVFHHSSEMTYDVLPGSQKNCQKTSLSAKLNILLIFFTTGDLVHTEEDEVGDNRQNRWTDAWRMENVYRV